jgi:CBS-domain-containing membrane protein
VDAQGALVGVVTGSDLFAAVVRCGLNQPDEGSACGS